MIRFLLFWLPLPVLAILNGTLRELFIVKLTDNGSAHQLSTISLLILFSFYGYIIKSKLKIEPVGDAVICGFTWVVLTLLFETGMGSLLQGKNTEEILAEYNILEGKLWPLIVLYTGLLPYFLFMIRKNLQKNFSPSK